MRYPTHHKHGTRARILRAASEVFRERGVASTGVDAVMRRAGLTHGGFYAHFRGKAELVAEACAAGFDAGRENFERIAALPTRRERVRALVLSYLSARHRDHPAAGCLVAALGLEAARPGGAARRGYAAALQRHRARLAAALRLADDPAENERLATALLSQLVGALILARSLADPAESGAVLRHARRTALEHFAPPPANPEHP
ncbi:MAG: TetR/AcrR family transcriptional regulator [Opitutaceae bacterium]|nr:TetR/AcrR family transcriptional regulator [Opitutaceae bacterium]